MVPSGWKLTSLGEVCSGNLQTGPFGSQLHAHEYTNDGVPVLMPKDLINQRADYKSASKIPPNRAEDLAKHLLKSGDILFSRRGDVTRFALIEEGDEAGICGTGCLKATPNSEHSPLFLSYFLQKNAVKRWLEQNAVGQTMPNMNTAILSELPLMVASSKNEEDNIAKILSTWDKAISTTERLINNSKQQKKALMQQLLSGKKRLLDKSNKPFVGDWNKIKLKDISTFITKGATPTTYGYAWQNSGIPFLRSECVGENGFKKSGLAFISEEAHQAMNRSKVYSGDILITITGNVGRVCQLPSYISEANLNQHIAKVTISSDLVVTNFIFHSLRNSTYRRSFERITTGQAYPQLSLEQIRNAVVFFPCKDEQQKIASLLTDADKEIELLEKQLDSLKQEKKALMQQLLTGKRRVKIDDKEVA